LNENIDLESRERHAYNSYIEKQHRVDRIGIAHNTATHSQKGSPICSHFMANSRRLASQTLTRVGLQKLQLSDQ
jgi:hypothetical protein